MISPGSVTLEAAKGCLYTPADIDGLVRSSESFLVFSIASKKRDYEIMGYSDHERNKEGSQCQAAGLGCVGFGSLVRLVMVSLGID